MATGTASIQIEYPESDGLSMGESDLHSFWMFYVRSLLEHRFRGQQNYITSNLALYFVEGDPRTYIVPDVFMVKDHPSEMRGVYKLWEERKAPNVAFEITSHSTHREDLAKIPKYQLIGVAELFLFDPTGGYLTPSLQGFRLGKCDYVAIPRDRKGNLYSRELDANLGLKDRELVLIDSSSGNRWLTAEEAAEAEREVAELERDVERTRSKKLEEEVSRLRDKLRKLLD